MVKMHTREGQYMPRAAMHGSICKAYWPPSRPHLGWCGAAISRAAPTVANAVTLLEARVGAAAGAALRAQREAASCRQSGRGGRWVPASIGAALRVLEGR
jgi:hypothetical protein